METRSFAAPALFADHHVTEVRRILLELTGVSDVYASSAFQLIEVTFDPEKTGAEDIAARLKETGYLDEIPLRAEPGIASVKVAGDSAFRHTVALETVKTISFAQGVAYEGRPLWHCPGMGTVRMSDE
jgi:copper chaperone CopZ